MRAWPRKSWALLDLEPLALSGLPFLFGSGFRRWSDKRTWGKGPIPGVGNGALANVTIPCGTAVLLDVPAVNLNMLVIRGMLQ